MSQLLRVDYNPFLKSARFKVQREVEAACLLLVLLHFYIKETGVLFLNLISYTLGMIMIAS